ncbi:MAG: exo-alpha-sialidase [Parabacteroides sp.]|nr:exo-alpha-sialidase [Parabacteroides sp.]
MIKQHLIYVFFLLSIPFITLAQSKTPPGYIVSHIPASTERYIGSPGLCILPDGSYLASHDEFGPKTSEFRSAKTYIFHSSDKGKNWKKIAKIDGQFWSNLFVHNRAVYIMGTHKHHGNVIIRRSDDGGYTWTNPYKSDTGLILEGEYHTAPMPVIIHNGRIWRAVEYATAPSTDWGKRYSAMVISAPVNADLLNAKNWRRTNHLMYDSTYLEGTFNGWLEGNVVVSPEGKMLDILRVDTKRKGEEYAAIVEISKNGKKASFNPETGFIPFPGGSKKFTIRYDEVSKRYWMLTNYVKPEFKQFSPSRIRNTQALCSSTDLKNWTVHQFVLTHPDFKHHGFQYVEWLFDGNDILFLSRTAYDEPNGVAHNNHDANYLTLHKIENFRDLINNSIE